MKYIKGSFGIMANESEIFGKCFFWMQMYRYQKTLKQKIETSTII